MKLEIPPEVLKRLETDIVIWLTTVSPNGTPQPSPVWFYWNGTEFLVQSQPSAYKLKNIERNPRVALNLEGASSASGEVIVFHGTARLNRAAHTIDPGYAAKYIQPAREIGYAAIDEFFRDYSVLIQINPTKLRAL